MASSKTYSLCTLYTIFCCKWTLIHSLIQKWTLSTFWKTGSIELGCCLYLFHVVVWIVSAATIFGGQHSWDDQNIPDDYIKARLYFSVGGCGRFVQSQYYIFYYIKTLITRKYYVISKLQLLCLYSLFSLFLRSCRFQWFDTLFVVYWHTTCCVGKRWCWEKYPAGCLDTWWVRQWPWTSKVEPFSTSSWDSKWENVKY